MRTMMTMAAMALATLVAGSAVARDWDGDFVPRDPIVKQPGHYEWSWEGDDGLSLEAPVTLHYAPGGPARVIATGPEALLSHLKFGQGHIRLDRDYRYSGHDRIEVTVSGVTVHDIALSGSGHAELQKLDLDRLHLAISGSGAVTGEGRADRLDVSISGSGKADLSRLAVRDANLHISGSGNVQVSPRDSANVAVSGSGTVRMARRPARLNQTVSGSGGVRFESN